MRAFRGETADPTRHRSINAQNHFFYLRPAFPRDGDQEVSRRLYFRIFGVVYGLVAVLGFIKGDGQLLGLTSNNMPDVWLHVAISLAALFLVSAFGTAPARMCASDKTSGQIQTTEGAENTEPGRV